MSTKTELEKEVEKLNRRVKQHENTLTIIVAYNRELAKKGNAVVSTFYQHRWIEEHGPSVIDDWDDARLKLEKDTEAAMNSLSNEPTQYYRANMGRSPILQPQIIPKNKIATILPNCKETGRPYDIDKKECKFPRCKLPEVNKELYCYNHKYMVRWRGRDV